MLAVAAIDAFRGLDARIADAQPKGVTYANSLVPFPSGTFAFGSVGIVLRRLPGLATDAVVAFFAAVTPATHDFWNASGREKQHESNHFIKNGATLGAELAVLLRASRK